MGPVGYSIMFVCLFITLIRLQSLFITVVFWCVDPWRDSVSIFSSPLYSSTNLVYFFPCAEKKRDKNSIYGVGVSDIISVVKWLKDLFFSRVCVRVFFFSPSVDFTTFHVAKKLCIDKWRYFVPRRNHKEIGGGGYSGVLLGKMKREYHHYLAIIFFIFTSPEYIWYSCWTLVTYGPSLYVRYYEELCFSSFRYSSNSWWRAKRVSYCLTLH